MGDSQLELKRSNCTYALDSFDSLLFFAWKNMLVLSKSCLALERNLFTSDFSRLSSLLTCVSSRDLNWTTWHDVTRRDTTWPLTLNEVKKLSPEGTPNLEPKRIEKLILGANFPRWKILCHIHSLLQILWQLPSKSRTHNIYTTHLFYHSRIWMT